jgi:hypothetical protein
MQVGMAGLILVLLAAAPAVAQTTAAEEVEQGRALYLAADFQAAAAAFDRALGSPTLTAEEALEAHRHLAALLLALGTESEARAHAAAAVALDPEATAPEGAPPGLVELLDEARGARASVAISAGALERGAATEIEATVAPAPDRLFGALRLRCADDTDAADGVEAEGPAPRVTVTLSVPDDATSIACHAAALSRGGADLVTAERRFELGETPVTPDQSTDDGGGLPAWPFIVGGAAVAVVAAVVIIVVVASSSGSDQARFGSTTVEGW